MHISKFLFLISVVLGQNGQHRLYKKLVMNSNDWSKFVHKTINFEVETKIECGASCNHHNEQCDMFIHKLDILECHIGTFENGNQNYLTGQNGDNPVYLSLGELPIYSSILLESLLNITIRFLNIEDVTYVINIEDIFGFFESHLNIY